MSTYTDCVSSLRASLSFLSSSVATLDAGVQDLPRLASVLKSVRVRLPSPFPPASHPQLTPPPPSTTN